MKKFSILALAAAVIGLAWAPGAFAGVGESRHDMASASNPYANLAAFADYGTCSACHIPHGAVGARLFPNVPVGAAGGFFGPLCQTCHDVSITNNVNIRTNTTVMQGHGLSILTLTASDVDEDVAGSGLPYTTGDAPSGADNIECLSCHDVHNTANNFRPFLQESLDDLCEDCHTNRVNNNTATVGYANAVSTHPAGPAFTGDVSGIATSPNSPFVAGWGAEFVANTGEALGSQWTDAIWNSGLQLSGQGAAGTGGVDCISCHNVHWDEGDAVPDNGTAYLGIVADNAGGNYNAFCEYCHQGATANGSYWNPGATAFSHPNDNTPAANAAVTADLTWMPVTSSATTGTGASGIVCTSCHGVHSQGGVETEPNSPILINYDDATYGDICQQCHSAGAGFTHHPTGGYATAGNNIGGVTCAGGDLPLGLGACHGVNGNNALAHNRSFAMGSPYPPNPTGPNEPCLLCHTANPSTYTPSNAYTADELGSHYIGDVATETWTNGRTAGAAGYIRYAGTGASNAAATNWDGSGMPSLFGSNATTLLCQSCHRLAQGNVISGNKPTGLLVEVAGAAIDTVASTVTDSTSYTTAPYVCTGCHLVPGGTHPLLDATAAAYPIGATAAGQSYTAANVNCESCHSPHDAETTGGSYILDGSGTDYGTGTGMEVEPTIDYTTFCAVCHGSFQ